MEILLKENNHKELALHCGQNYNLLKNIADFLGSSEFLLECQNAIITHKKR